MMDNNYLPHTMFHDSSPSSMYQLPDQESDHHLSSSSLLNFENYPHAQLHDSQIQDNKPAADNMNGQVMEMVNDPSSSSSTMIGSENEAKTEKSKGEKKAKKPRHAFQTRSQVDILDDGYRWRKYGQKAVKNNKFPRSYYRCTYQGCNVKKQVQRLSKDETIVVTTYEGVHSHSIEKSTENFEHILNQMQIYNPT